MNLPHLWLVLLSDSSFRIISASVLPPFHKSVSTALFFREKCPPHTLPSPHSIRIKLYSGWHCRVQCTFFAISLIDFLLKMIQYAALKEKSLKSSAILHECVQDMPNWIDKISGKMQSIQNMHGSNLSHKHHTIFSLQGTCQVILHIVQSGVTLPQGITQSIQCCIINDNPPILKEFALCRDLLAFCRLFSRTAASKAWACAFFLGCTVSAKVMDLAKAALCPATRPSNRLCTRGSSSVTSSLMYWVLCSRSENVSLLTSLLISYFLWSFSNDVCTLFKLTGEASLPAEAHNVLQTFLQWLWTTAAWHLKPEFHGVRSGCSVLHCKYDLSWLPRGSRQYLLVATWCHAEMVFVAHMFAPRTQITSGDWMHGPSAVNDVILIPKTWRHKGKYVTSY